MEIIELSDVEEQKTENKPSPSMMKNWICNVCNSTNECTAIKCDICHMTELCPLCGHPNMFEDDRCTKCKAEIKKKKSLPQKRKQHDLPQPPKKRKRISPKQSLMTDFLKISPKSSKPSKPQVVNWADSDSENEDLQKKDDKPFLEAILGIDDPGPDLFKTEKRMKPATYITSPISKPSPPKKKKRIYSPSPYDSFLEERKKKPKQPKKKSKKKERVNRWKSGKYLQEQNDEWTEESHEATNFPEATILEEIPKNTDPPLIIEAIIKNNVEDKPILMKRPKFKVEDLRLILQSKVTVIFGKSGSGKTTLLNQIAESCMPEWDNEESLLANFAGDGIDYITAAGLRSVPNFVKPYSVLSHGERARADFAKLTESGHNKRWKKPILIDEFTSDLDRSTARSMATSAASAISRNFRNGQFIFASCNVDIIHYLQPDLLVYVSDGQIAILNNLNSGKRPLVTVSITPKELLPLRNHKGEIQMPKADPREVYGKPVRDFQNLNQKKNISKCAHTEEKIRGGIVLKNKVKENAKNNIVNSIFDVCWHGINYFRVPNFEPLKFLAKEETKFWRLGVVWGPSGSGKSTIKKLYFPQEPDIQWDSTQVLENHFPEDENVRKEIFEACKLTKHTLKPYTVLSNGEKFRADLARVLSYAHSNRESDQIYVIDEFTSVLDRKTAFEIAKGFNAFIKKYDLKRFLIVSCHSDYFKHLDQLTWAYCASTQHYYQFDGAKQDILSPNQFHRRNGAYGRKRMMKKQFKPRKLFDAEADLSDKEYDLFHKLKTILSLDTYKEEYIAKFVRGATSLDEAINKFYDVDGKHPPEAFKQQEPSISVSSDDEELEFNDDFTEEDRKIVFKNGRVEIKHIVKTLGMEVHISDKELNKLLYKHKYDPSETFREEFDKITKPETIRKASPLSLPSLESSQESKQSSLNMPYYSSPVKRLRATPVRERCKARDLLYHFIGSASYELPMHRTDPDEQFVFFDSIVKTEQRCKIMVQTAEIQIDLVRCHWSEWRHFRAFHYKSKNLQTSCVPFIALHESDKVGFLAVGNMVGRREFAPLGKGDRCFWHEWRRRDQWWRESRLVVKPSFQGMGIGSRMSDAMGELMRGNKRNYSSKTAHPNFGNYRNRSPLWIPQTGNGKVVDGKKSFTHRFAAVHDEECEEALENRIKVIGDFPPPEGKYLSEGELANLRSKDKFIQKRKCKKAEKKSGAALGPWGHTCHDY